MRRGPATALLAAGLAALLAACTGPGSGTASAPASAATASAAAATPSASPSRTGWSDVESSTRGAVFRIQTTSCTSGLSGVTATGFAIGEHLVVTAAHVVEYQQKFALRSDDGDTEGEVLGFDPAQDVALLWIQSPAATTLDFSDTAPSQAQDVALLGFPKGGRDLRTAAGTVTSLDGTGTVAGSDGSVQRQGLLVTDLALDPGFSGGPVIDAQGRVLGVTTAQSLAYSSAAGAVLAAEGTSYASRPAQFAELIEKWRARTSWVNTCNPDSINHVIQNLDTATGDGAAPAAALDAFWLTVNDGDYSAAWALMNSTGQRVKGNLDRWTTRVNGSEYSDGYLESVTASGARSTIRVIVNLTKPDADGLASECTVWRLRYRLSRESGKWLMGAFSGGRTGTC